MKKILILSVALILSFSLCIYADSETDEAEKEGLVPEYMLDKYDTDITRAEYAEMLCVLYDKIGGEDSGSEDISPFTDTDNESVKKAYRLGIVKGKTDDMFAPGDFLTRQEAMTMLMRMILKLNPDYDKYLHAEYTFIDDWQIGYWAKNYIDFAYYCGIIQGTDEYVISPIDNITRRQAALMSIRTLKNITDYLKTGEGYSSWEWYIKPKYDGLVRNTKFCSGRAAVKQNGKYGYIDIEGNDVTGFKYDDAFNFSNGMAKVKKDGKFGYIDRFGNEVIPAVYDGGGDFSEDLVWVMKDGLYGCLDKYGEEILPFEYEHAYKFTEGVASVKKNGLYGYIDREGNTVIDFKFLWAAEFHEERARVGEKGRYGYIDHSGSVVIPMIYEQALDFHEERAAVYYRDYGGIIDRSGNVIVPFFRYSEVSTYTSGLTHVRNHGVENPDYSGYQYYLDPDGKNMGASNGNYEIHEGLAAVTYSNTVHGKIVPYLRDKKGAYVIPSTDDYYAFSDEEKNCYLFMSFSEGFAGAVNRSGKLGFIKNPLLNLKEFN